MNCAACGTPNDVGRKFCRECGSQLGLVCPGCGAIETGDSKFCGECGSSLARERTTQRPSGAHEQAPAATTERRLVSVLFADLVGFTPLAEDRDPEHTRELLSDYYDLARQVVGRYRGSIEKFIGDAVMAVWGAPIAREDDSERAVRCALDLVQAVNALATTRSIPNLAVRVAVHTGEAAVSIGVEGQGMVAGDVVNTAARLQTVAQPGTVVVGDATQRAASRSVAFRRMPDQALKGKAVPVATWEATHLTAVSGGSRRQDLLEPPFVGRTDELWLLKELYHATVRERRARLVSIIGQAGLGKTRLVWELEKYASGLAEESRWFQGRSPAYDEGVSYWALGEMVRRAAGIAELDDAGLTRDKLRSLLTAEAGDAAEIARLEQPLGALLGIDPIPEKERSELFVAWRTFFERAADRAPIVLVFEDVHWADGGVLDFIEHLLQWARSFPILLVTVARPELLERRPNWGAGQRSFTSLRLDPLSEDEMRQLLEGIAPGLPQSIVRQVLDRAEGVPLYAVETIRMLIDRDVVVAAEGGYRVARQPEKLELPETLHELIAARLDGLPPGEKKLLREASVLGQTFTLTALANLAQARPGDLEGQVSSLVDKELLRLESDTRSPERGQLGFVQAAVREVAYGGLGRSERRLLHLRAAEDLSRLDDEEIAGVVASHYLAAYQAAPDHAGSDAVRERAVGALVAAADRARGLHSYDQALGHLDQALSVSRDGDERAGISERAGNVARSSGDEARAERYLRDAIAWYRQKDDRSAIARATATLATVLIDDQHIEQAISLLNEAMDELGTNDDPDLVPLMANLSRAYLNRSDWQAAVDWADRAIAAGERFGLTSTVVEALVNRGSAVVSLGRPLEAQAVLSGAVALAHRHDGWLSVMRATRNLVAIELDESPRAALERLAGGLELAERVGELGWLSSMRHLHIQLRLELGDWQDVLDEIAGLDEEALLAHEWEHLHDSLAVVAAIRGDGQEARRLVERWVSQPERTVTQHEAAHFMALARVAFAGGAFEEARTWAGQATEGDAYRDEGHFLAGRSALWLRDATALHRTIAILREAQTPSRRSRAYEASLGAGLKALLEKAAEHEYGEAIRRWTELENPLEVALAQLELSTFGTSGASAAAAEAEARRLLVGLDAESLIERLRTPVVTQT